MNHESVLKSNANKCKNILRGFALSPASLCGFRDGFAALTAAIFVFAVSAVIIAGFTFVALREVRITRNLSSSVRGYYAAESGVEDAIYRFVSGKQIVSGETISTGTATGTIVITAAGSQKTITVEGVLGNVYRTVEAVIAENTVGASFFYGVQVSDGGLQMSNNSTVNGNVYSNGDINGGAGSTITGSATVAGGINANPSVQWTAENADQNFATVSSNRDIAQSFTANASDKINKVSVYLAKVGNPTSNITLYITTDNGGKPASSDIASAVISYTSVGITASWIDTALPNPPTLTAGAKYWIVLDYGSNSSSNYWNWRKDASDGYAGNTGRYTSNWSSGSASWTNVGGDLAFRVWLGGVNTKIDGVTIGNATSGEGHANLFIDATVHGSSCPNAYCFVENPLRQEMPISDGVIQDWRNAAAAGGTCAPPDCDASGNFKITGGASKSIGPKKITGNLEVDNNAILTVTGTLWVQGNVVYSNGCIVKLAPSYGGNSGVIVVDGTANVSNNCSFSGSGVSGSYIMLLSAKDAPTENVMTIDNNATGVIYYASNGRIKFSNNAAAKEATAYGITLDNNAVITYESGLSSVSFSSGPSGGYDIVSWEEVE